MSKNPQFNLSSLQIMLGHSKKHKQYWETGKFFLFSQLKVQKYQSNEGFTLIELLVAMIIALLVISPLLGLAVNLLQTDRQEQAKATSEEEIQLASDFISRDLKQAVHIYDRDALTKTGIDGIKDDIPPVAGSVGSGCIDITVCQPVLVFWKRKPVADAIPRDALSKDKPGVNCKDAANAGNCDDTFVYSLVGYYLIEDNNANGTWSNTARIARFEISDGLTYPDTNEIPEARSKQTKDSGFKLFDLSESGTTIADKMNRWTKDSGAFNNNQLNVLVDYIDQSTGSESELKPEPCPDQDDSNGDPLWSQTPENLDQNTDATGFSACINTQANAVRFSIRGNALARIQSKNSSPEFSDRRSSYFPSITTEVQSVSKLVQ